MKTLFLTLLLPILAFQAIAYEGVLEYRIKSGDRDWKMVSYLKDGFSKSEIHLGDTHYQSILSNEEGEFLIDELNKQVFSTDYERKKWGTTKQQDKKKKRSRNKFIADFSEGDYSGKIYSVRYKRKNYHLKIAKGMGYVPGIFLEQFSSMSGFALDGEPLFKKEQGLPLAIYRDKKPDQLILELVSNTPQSVSDETFLIGEKYIRAKMRFRMR